MKKFKLSYEVFGIGFELAFFVMASSESAAREYFSKYQTCRARIVSCVEITAAPYGQSFAVAM